MRLGFRVEAGGVPRLPACTNGFRAEGYGKSGLLGCGSATSEAGLGEDLVEAAPWAEEKDEEANEIGEACRAEERDSERGKGEEECEEGSEEAAPDDGPAQEEAGAGGGASIGAEDAESEEVCAQGGSEYEKGAELGECGEAEGEGVAPSVNERENGQDSEEKRGEGKAAGEALDRFG
ncbi:MAG: hypothetical protein RLZZ142_2935, partial [Verrucomicrobiota bacterium]